ncbi:4Fe-4S dicluster domain-containing protein [candidate division WOR-3 bacterium]|nr:4Fe-4S dicluster domain-containing protein [candidate division WOR-3 bacterium]
MRSFSFPHAALATFYKNLSEFGVTYYPRLSGQQTSYELWQDEELDNDDLLKALKMVRPVEPLKEFFLTSREQVASFPQLFTKDIKPRVIVGAKGCDIHTLIDVQDNIYLKGDNEDPFYKERREKYYIITVDCPEPVDTCFCNILDGTPYTAWGGDLNISFGEKSLIIDILSEKGEKLSSKLSDIGIIKEVTDDELKYRDKIRANAERKLAKINRDMLPTDLPERIESKVDPDFWRKALANCVDCQACERICPTCYCFLLYDIPAGKGFERTKVLDFCYHAAYGRVGGGANPLANFPHRLRNRFECKFMAFPRNFKVIACTGCGRCISACSGKIDIREVLRAL